MLHKVAGAVPLRICFKGRVVSQKHEHEVGNGCDLANAVHKPFPDGHSLLLSHSKHGKHLEKGTKRVQNQKAVGEDHLGNTPPVCASNIRSVRRGDCRVDGVWDNVPPLV